MRVLFCVAACGIAAMFAGGARAGSLPVVRYYVVELAVEQGIETNGVPYWGRTLPVDVASCIGLRRFGVKRLTAVQMDTFWQFLCTADGADGHTYQVRLSTWTGPRVGAIYPRYSSVVRVF